MGSQIAVALLHHQQHRREHSCERGRELRTECRMGKKRSTASAGGSKGRSISKRDYKILKQVFIEYDKDSSGTVTYQEFLRALEGDDACSHGLKKSAAGMFDQMDGDQDGEMDFKELLLSYYPLCTREEIEKFVRKFEPPPVVVEVQKRELTEEQLEELEGVMRIFDKDGDGSIEKKELLDYAANVGIDDESAQKWFDDYDIDKDGYLNAEEFKEFFRDEWPDQ